MSPSASKGSGAVRMRALAATLPTQLKEGFRAGQALAPPATGRSTTVFTVGMGGSGISSELARGVVEAETPVALKLVRSPDLPRAVEKKSRVVVVSYSGDTWEALRAYDAAGRAGASRIALTSGGTLAERAERDGVPVLPLPPGLPPRAAVGRIFGGILGLLDPWFPESNEDRVDRTANRVAALIPSYARARGPARAIAARIGSRVPVFYAESSFVGLARRWKTQVEENAKRLAAFDEVPELFHNAVVGWDAIGRSEAARYAVCLLQWAEEPALTRRGFAYVERLLTERGAQVVRVPLPAEDRLESIVGGVALGDYVSLFLAEQRRVDPYPIDALTRLKTTLASQLRH
ncbi:MAG: SIS domain-containing protein [Thermoplasmata archaeon]